MARKPINPARLEFSSVRRKKKETHAKPRNFVRLEFDKVRRKKKESMQASVKPRASQKSKGHKLDRFLRGGGTEPRTGNYHLNILYSYY